jgi:hypothetical protein
MIQINPDFSTFPESNGIIWLKRVEHSLSPSVGAERLTVWVILGRTGLDERWLKWSIPSDGAFVEASVYSPGSGSKVADVPSINDADAGVRSVSFANLPEEFILVVAYRESFPDRLAAEDVVWAEEELPMWEAIITVSLPESMPFYHMTNFGAEMTETVQRVGGRSSGEILREWRVINAPASRGLMRAEPRRCVAFSSTKGSQAVISMLRGLDATVPVISESVTDKTAWRFLQWLYDRPVMRVEGGSVRNNIPSTPPWTREEKVLLAYRKLSAAGMGYDRLRLLRRFAYAPDDGEETPVCAAMAAEPVLAIKGDGGAFVYLDMASRPRQGDSSLTLWGTQLRGLVPGGADVEEVRVPYARDNKLSLLFEMKLGADGTLDGFVKATGRGAWRDIMASAGDEGFLREIMPSVRSYREIGEGGKSRRRRENTDEITAVFETTRAIAAGSNMLVSFPTVLPAWLNAMSAPLLLRFPFSIDARVHITMPPGAVDVLMPEAMDRGSGKARCVTSYRVARNKKTAAAEARLNVSNVSFAADDASTLASAIQAWRVFMSTSLPVRLRQQ